MRKLMNRRGGLKEAMNQAHIKIKGINADYKLSEEGKQESIDLINADIINQLQQAGAEALAAFNQRSGEAEKAYNEMKAVDKDIMQRAAIELGPILANMDNDNLLRFYASADNHGERAYAEKVAQVRVKSGKPGGQLEAFAMKFTEEKARIDSTLPGSDRLNQINGESDYLNSLNIFYNNELQLWSGQGAAIHQVSRTMAAHAVDLFEQNYTGQ